MDSAGVSNGNQTFASNFIRILPTISQGDGNFGERIGNEVRLKNLNINMILRFAEQVSGQSGADPDHTGSRVGVRVMILKQKANQNFVEAQANWAGDKFLETGAQSSQGLGYFNGNTIDLMSKINRDAFSVRYDKVFNMSRAWEWHKENSIHTFQHTPKSVMLSKKLTFGKRGLKLHFAQDADDVPVNFPYLILVAYASTTTNQLLGTAPTIEVTYSSTAAYTDA